VNQGHSDPAVQWAGQLARLDELRHQAVVAALRHSDATGWPASGEAVALLVSYALGEITARDYATGILHSLGVTNRDLAVLDVPPPSRSAYVVSDVDAPVDPATRRAPQRATSREDAVHAYVTGQIPVGEFLRLARG